MSNSTTVQNKTGNVAQDPRLSKPEEEKLPLIPILRRLLGYVLKSKGRIGMSGSFSSSGLSRRGSWATLPVLFWAVVELDMGHLCDIACGLACSVACRWAGTAVFDLAKL